MGDDGDGDSGGGDDEKWNDERKDEKSQKSQNANQGIQSGAEVLCHKHRHTDGREVVDAERGPWNKTVFLVEEGMGRTDLKGVQDKPRFQKTVATQSPGSAASSS